MKLRALTYNIKSCRGIGGSGSLSSITRTIAATKADIAGLQEVDYLNPRSGFAHQALRISRILGMEYAYGPNARWFLLARLGNAIISRYPILAASNFTLSGSGEKRGLLIAHIDLGSQSVLFCTTHLGLGQRERLRQAQQITRLVNFHDYPLLLTGDFNALPGSSEMQPIQAMLRSVDPQGAWPTFPSTAPISKIDDIFYSDHWRLTAYRVYPGLASDHLPCLATFKLKTNHKQGDYKLLT